MTNKKTNTEPVIREEKTLYQHMEESNFYEIKVAHKTRPLRDSELSHACEEGYLDVVKFLIEELNLDPSETDNAAIRRASNRGKLEVVKYLLTDKRVNPVAKNGAAVYHAAHNGHLEIVKILLDHTHYPPDGLANAIIAALKSNHEEVAIHILDRNKKVMSILSEISNSDHSTMSGQYFNARNYMPYIRKFITRYRVESRNKLINEIIDEE